MNRLASNAKARPKQRKSGLLVLQYTAVIAQVRPPARLWRDDGKCVEARDLLTPIYGGVTEGFDTPVVQEAKALLDQLT